MTEFAEVFSAPKNGACARNKGINQSRLGNANGTGGAQTIIAYNAPRVAGSL